MNGKTLGLILVLAVLLAAALGGGGAWLVLHKQMGAATKPAAEPELPKEYRFVSLDKLLVMLRDESGNPLGHYLATDLVLRTTKEEEKAATAELPYLRSVALKALAALPLDKASAMSIDQYQTLLNQATREAYLRDKRKAPFTEVMIGKLIIE